MKQSWLMMLLCSLVTLVAAQVEESNSAARDRTSIAQMFSSKQSSVCNACAKVCPNIDARVDGDPDLARFLVLELFNRQPYVDEQCPAICTEILHLALQLRARAFRDRVHSQRLSGQLTHENSDRTLRALDLLERDIPDYTCDDAFDSDGDRGPDASGSGGTAAKDSIVQQSQDTNRAGSKERNQKDQPKGSLDPVFAVPRPGDTGSGGGGGGGGYGSGRDSKFNLKTSPKATKELLRSNSAKFGFDRPSAAGAASGRGFSKGVSDFVNRVGLATGALGLGLAGAAKAARADWGGAY